MKKWKIIECGTFQTIARDFDSYSQARRWIESRDFGQYEYGYFITEQ